MRKDAGQTLAELLVVTAIAGVLAALAVWGIRGWAVASAFRGTPSAIQSVLRATQMQAITEGTSFCVQFDTAADEYTVYRFACDDPGKVKVRGPYGTGSSRVHLVAPAFVDSTDTGRTGVTYRPRGSAWPGSVTVVREGSSSTHAVHVDSVTGRVWTT